MSSLLQNNRTKLEYSRTKIIKAGEAIKKGKDNQDTYEIIDNWRAAHAFPMDEAFLHLNELANNHPDIIVAERLKRRQAIVDKLKHEQTMSLWNMQDIGGCRVIVPDNKDVRVFFEKFTESQKFFVLDKVNDYIINPKTDGYRSLHAIYKYHNDQTDEYNRNMLIEVQFRSRLQHAWATAVEMIKIFKGEDIKSGQCSNDLGRFMVLVSSLFAILEREPRVPNTSVNSQDIFKEIIKLDNKNKYLEFFDGLKAATKAYNEQRDLQNATCVILVLDYKKRLLKMEYQFSEISEANKRYAEIERNNDKNNTYTVLVQVSSFDQLSEAYPNYYLDITGFVKIVRSNMSFFS
jgi:ppGpp synthetase/RelA/SpoT-type nucleotidyltranferase